MKYIIDTEKQTMEPVTPLTGSIGEAIDKLSEMYNIIGLMKVLRRLAEAVDTLEKRPTVPTFIPLGTFPSPQPLYQPPTFLDQPIDPWAKVPFTEPRYPILTGTTCAVNQADGESEPQQDDRPF